MATSKKANQPLLKPEKDLYGYDLIEVLGALEHNLNNIDVT